MLVVYMSDISLYGQTGYLSPSAMSLSKFSPKYIPDLITIQQIH